MTSHKVMHSKANTTLNTTPQPNSSTLRHPIDTPSRSSFQRHLILRWLNNHGATTKCYSIPSSSINPTGTYLYLTLGYGISSMSMCISSTCALVGGRVLRKRSMLPSSLETLPSGTWRMYSHNLRDSHKKWTHYSPSNSSRHSITSRIMLNWRLLKCMSWSADMRTLSRSSKIYLLLDLSSTAEVD